MNNATLLKHLINKIRSPRQMASHDYHNVFQKAKRLLSSSLDIELPNSSILVIGCGYNNPEALLWSAVSDHSVGIDLRKAFWSTGFLSLFRESRNDGLSRMQAYARTIIQRLLYRTYYRHLSKISGLSFNDSRQDLVTYDGKCLPFAGESFDIVYSNAVLEHVADLRTLSREMHRVTKKNGVCYHLWHNYYSLSGAHVPDTITATCPWGHLLGDTRVDNWLEFSNTYLNKKQPDEIISVLSRNYGSISVHQLDQYHNVKGIDHDFDYEGLHILSSDLQEKMKNYPREYLLTRAYSFLGRKREFPENGIPNDERNP